MIPVDLTRNFFDLFNIPVGFDVELKSLSENYRALQNAVHPDKFANSTGAERRLSVQQSARINEGYQILKDPLERARYLLQLQGVDVSPGQSTIMDSGFLMQQMELRETLEAVKDSADPIGQLLALGDSIDEMTGTLVGDIAALFEKQFAAQAAGQTTEQSSARHEKIHDYVRRLQFMKKLGEEIMALEERFG